MAGTDVGTLTPPTTVTTAYTALTTPNLVIENKIIASYIKVRAGGIKFYNCKFIGGGFLTSGNTALVDANHSAVRDLVIDHCTFQPQNPSVAVDGLLGHDFHISNSNILGSVDGIGVYNVYNNNGPANVLIENCWIHDLFYFSPDPNHPDNQTHNDCIQIQGNSGITIRGNRLEAKASTTVGNGYPGASPAPVRRNLWYPSVSGQCIAFTANAGHISGVLVENNYLNYGAQSITALADRGGVSGLTIQNNKFGHNQPVISKSGVSAQRAIMLELGVGSNLRSTTGPDQDGNVYLDNGEPITVYRLDEPTSSNVVQSGGSSPTPDTSGSTPGGPVTAPPPPTTVPSTLSSTVFVLGDTEPSWLNVGAGVERAYPKTLVNTDVVLHGTDTLQDTVVNGRVICLGSANVIDNVVVRGGSTAPTSRQNLIETSGATGQVQIRFTDVRPQVPNENWDGIGSKNYHAYRSKVWETTRGFVATSKTSDGITNVKLEANFVPVLAQWSSTASSASGDDHTVGTPNYALSLEGNHDDITDIIAIGNSFNGALSPIKGTQPTKQVNQAAVMSNLINQTTCAATFTQNWFRNGYPFAVYLDFGTWKLTGNRFTRPGATCVINEYPIGAKNTANITSSNNIYIDTAQAILTPRYTTDPSNPPPPPPPDDSGSFPPVTPGVQPTGTGIIKYQDLSGSKFSTRVNSAGTSALVSLPSGVFEFSDFSDGNQAIGYQNFAYGAKITTKGLLGSGSGSTIVQMKAGTSTKRGDIPPQSLRLSSNNLSLITTTSSDARYENFRLQGTNQGHLYSGLMFVDSHNVTVNNMIVAGIPGNSGSPPGETTMMNFQRCTGTIRVNNLVADGENLAACGVESNHSAGTFIVNNFVAKNTRYSAGWASWHQQGPMTFNNWHATNCCRHFNAEGLAGAITFVDPIWNDPFSGHYDSNFTWEPSFQQGTLTWRFSSSAAWQAFIAGRSKKKITIVCASNGLGNIHAAVRVFIGGQQMTTTDYVSFTGS